MQVYHFISCVSKRSNFTSSHHLLSNPLLSLHRSWFWFNLLGTKHYYILMTYIAQSTMLNKCKRKVLNKCVNISCWPIWKIKCMSWFGDLDFFFHFGEREDPNVLNLLHMSKDNTQVFPPPPPPPPPPLPSLQFSSSSFTLVKEQPFYCNQNSPSYWPFPSADFGFDSVYWMLSSITFFKCNCFAQSSMYFLDKMQEKVINKCIDFSRWPIWQIKCMVW